MSEKSVTIQLSKVLCFGSKNAEECPFCGNGPCDPKMSDTFLREAQIVLAFLIDTKLVTKAKLL